MNFQDLPIKRKLVGVIFLTSLCVLALTCLMLLTYEILRYKRTTSRSLTTIAEIISANSTAVLVFDDQKLAREILSGLRAESAVTAAALFDREGKLFATYPPDLAATSLPAAPAAEGIDFQAKYVTLSKPVVQGENRVGTLFLKADLGEMYRRLSVYVMVLVLVLSSSGILAYYLSNYFERRISQPLLDLANTARTVSEQKDYSIRGIKTSNDELGYLTEAFNSMLSQIQAGHSALRESETRLAGVFSQAGAGIAQCDLTGRFVLVNDRYCEITGHSRAALLQKRMQDITHPDDLADSQSALNQLIAGSSSPSIEKRYIRADGEIVWGRASVVPLRNAEGEIETALSVIQDITEGKRAEQEVKRARDVAERANRAKDEFLAALSHELRTPLNPVLLLASESANDPSLPESVRADFATIAKNVTLEARLIDDLLDITRITQGKLSLELRSADVHAVLQDALATVRADLDQKRIELEFDLNADQHALVGDPVRLQQVFWNILKNAVKFTPERGKIVVKTSAAPDGRDLSIVISDTGIGITPAELGGIFEAFKQGEHANKDITHRFGGLGLGLAISRMLVELHAGSIRAISAGRDQGATFIVTLPLTTEQPDAKPAPEGINSPPAAFPNGARPIHILLVEDHEPTRTALAHLLRRRHYEVKAAGSLEEARALFTRENFDLLISDIGLPDGTGHELMKEIRLHSKTIRGIALTGYGMEQDIASSEAAGFVAHLVKPVRVESLEQALAVAATGSKQNGTGFGD